MQVPQNGGKFTFFFFVIFNYDYCSQSASEGLQRHFVALNLSCNGHVAGASLPVAQPLDGADLSRSERSNQTGIFLEKQVTRECFQL